MPTRLSLRPPADYVLARDVCSYGYYLLSPNHWEPSDYSFTTILDLESGRLRQIQTPGAARLPAWSRRLGP